MILIDPLMVADQSNEPLEAQREKQARTYAQLKTPLPTVIAKQLRDGSFEILDGRRRVRAATLRGEHIWAFVTVIPK